MEWTERVPERYGYYWAMPPGGSTPQMVWADGDGGYHMILDPVRYKFSGDEVGTLYAGPVEPPTLAQTAPAG